jgi:hypothetical protein
MATTGDVAEVRATLEGFRTKEPPLRCGEPMRSWYVKYTSVVVDFLLTLPDERLDDWENLFTALYELTGMGFHHFAEPDVRTEDQAWFRVDPWEHVLYSRHYSLLPEGVDVFDFVGDYLAFIIYLGRERIIAREVCRELYRRYCGLLRRAA